MTLTPEQLAKSREEFERHIKSLPGFIAEVLNIDDGRYSYSGTEFMWKGWMARQESLVVELPFELDENGDHERFWRKNLVISALQSAGINYREKE